VILAPGSMWVAGPTFLLYDHAFFARAGFTEAARTEARSAGAQLVDLATLDADLRQTLTNPQAT